MNYQQARLFYLGDDRLINRRQRLQDQFVGLAWEPIWWVLDRIGGQSSLQLVQDLAIRLCPDWWSPSLAYCCAIRKKWQNANDIQRDCRTYSGQPARNMVRGRRAPVPA